ncbi:unnamed protein product [Rotaria socialis]|uniref:Chitin-binding type-1 domain-containing protein n=1 Tax=Rotaria socialis TaxID=392032 RepID=A0A818QE29_9BILA|nr:unnamed protein product [Rotaria socialis]CAF3317714.1 unnamed protein product [Rotaria socialis]CAF3319076.1 unnamed protein product [Rotaria socialis]CAF3633308.1 unnamed protein product [Rotaria socialis]CAF4196655.1 unnamed protein product [Rotaria socialis]
MATSRYMHICLLLSVIVVGLIPIIHGSSDEQETNVSRIVGQRATCPDSTMCASQWGYCGHGESYCGTGCTSGPCSSGNSGGSPIIVNPSSVCPESTMCMSKWDYCGTGEAFCGDGCKGGPCWGGNNGGGGGNGNNGNTDDGSIITEQSFSCVFNTIDAGTRFSRLTGLRNSGWKPSNKEEAAVFLAHVFHETDGLKTIREYCAPGCGSHYAGSWCDIQSVPNKLYYGRGWFQLSWPCNYHAAGRALGVDLLNNPDLVEQQQDLAVKTAIWFYNANNMAGPAKQGDFAATTRIINGALECNGGPGFSNQMARVGTYRRVRQCFSLGEPNRNPVC